MSTNKLSAEEWIILRLLMRLSDKPTAKNQYDMARSVIYLIRKHGSKVIMDAITTLQQEGTKQ